VYIAAGVGLAIFVALIAFRNAGTQPVVEEPDTPPPTAVLPRPRPSRLSPDIPLDADEPVNERIPERVMQPARSDFSATPSMELDRAFVADIQKIKAAGVDETLIVHAIVRQFHRQTEAMQALGMGAEPGFEDIRAAKRKEWVDGLLSPGAYERWANRGDPAERAPASELLPPQLVGQLQSLRTSGVDETILAHIAATQMSDQFKARMKQMHDQVMAGTLPADQYRSWQLIETYRGQEEKAIVGSLGTAAYDRWKKQGLFRFGADIAVSGLTEQQAETYYALHKEWQQQLRAVAGARLNADDLSSEASRLESEFRARLHATFGDEVVRRLPIR
jgi:hypothetical protein